MTVHIRDLHHVRYSRTLCMQPIVAAYRALGPAVSNDYRDITCTGCLALDEAAHIAHDAAARINHPSGGDR